MKKLTFVAAMAIAAATMTSCGNGAPSANLKSDVDSLTYAVGMSNSNGLIPYLAQMGIDSTKIDMFVKGLKKGAAMGDDKSEQAYMMGVQIGQQMVNQAVPGITRQIYGDDSTKTIDAKTFMAGFIAGTLQKGTMTMEQAQKITEDKMMAIKAKEMEKKFGDWKKKNEAFLADNKKKDSIKTLPSGLQYRVLKAGNGPIAKDTSRVKINYEGRTIDGNVFESTFKNDEPITMRANQFVPGFNEALQLMPEGSLWEIFIPSELAYGPQDKGKIKPFSTLIFKVEMKEVNAKMQKMGGPMPGRPRPRK